MAKQLGNIRFERKVIDDLVFYKMDGQYYVRVKSSLTGKRVKTKPEFRKTKYYAGLLGRASKIGSLIYKSLPERWRQFWMYQAFTGEAMIMLKEGKVEDEVKNVLWKRYVEYWEKKKEAKVEVKKKSSVRNIGYIIFNNNQYYMTGWAVSGHDLSCNRSFVTFYKLSQFVLKETFQT